MLATPVCPHLKFSVDAVDSWLSLVLIAGLVRTSIWGRNAEKLPKGFQTSAMSVMRHLLLAVFGVSNEQGACTPIYLAADPQAAMRGGNYWDRFQLCASARAAYDDKLGAELWNAWLSTEKLNELPKI